MTCFSFGLKELKSCVLTSLSLESIDNIERGDGLTLGMFGVCDSVANDTLEEGLQNTTGLFVDHCRIGLIKCVRDAEGSTY